MSEQTYTLADLEQARKQALDDAARTVLNWPLPTIQAPSMWLIDKHGIAADIRALGPIGETREETERRVVDATIKYLLDHGYCDDDVWAELDKDELIKAMRGK